jgi:hypothetical protein
VEPFWIGRRLPDKTLILGDSAALGSAGGVSEARFGESALKICRRPFEKIILQTLVPPSEHPQSTEPVPFRKNRRRRDHHCGAAI